MYIHTHPQKCIHAELLIFILQIINFATKFILSFFCFFIGVMKLSRKMERTSWSIWVTGTILEYIFTDCFFFYFVRAHDIVFLLSPSSYHSEIWMLKPLQSLRKLRYKSVCTARWQMWIGYGKGKCSECEYPLLHSNSEDKDNVGMEFSSLCEIYFGRNKNLVFSEINRWVEKKEETNSWAYVNFFGIVIGKSFGTHPPI